MTLSKFNYATSSTELAKSNQVSNTSFNLLVYFRDQIFFSSLQPITSARSQSQYSHRNATDGENLCSRKSFHGEIHKGAGSGWGWGCGRGMLENNFSDTYAHSEHSRNFQSGRSGNESICQSSSWDSRVHNAYKGTHNTIEKWTPQSFGRGVGDLRISDSQQGYMCRGRAQPSAAGASGQHRDRWSRDSSGSTTTNAWRHYPSSGSSTLVDNRNFPSRHNVHPSAAAVSGQHGDKWSQDTSGSTTTNAWRQYPSSASSPSKPGLGRGRYMPKTAPTDWKLRDMTGTSSTEIFPRSQLRWGWFLPG